MIRLELQGSVGIGARNAPEDILAVQAALNALLHLLPGSEPLVLDSTLGPVASSAKTTNIIKQFQRQVAGFVEPDGRIDPAGRTHKAINRALELFPGSQSPNVLPPVRGEQGLTAQDYQSAAEQLGCESAVIRAVEEVESRGSAFLDSGRPVILFEAHVFSRLTHHAHDFAYPELSAPKWSRKLYQGGEKEYARLQQAMALSRSAALRATSWGKFQLMGFNHQQAGFEHLEAFVEAMFYSEAAQLQAFVDFIKSQQLGPVLATHDWQEFARRYNGIGYAANRYHVKLKQAYNQLVSRPHTQAAV